MGVLIMLQAYVWPFTAMVVGHLRQARGAETSARRRFVKNLESALWSLAPRTMVREMCGIALFRIRLAAWDRIGEGG